MKIWTYKYKFRSFLEEIGIIIKIEEETYYRTSLAYLLNFYRYKENRKRKRLTKYFFNTLLSHHCFPSNGEDVHFLGEVDKIYVHEIVRLLKKLS